MLTEKQEFQLKLFRDNLAHDYKELSRRKESLPDDENQEQAYQTISYYSLKEKMELLDNILLSFDNLVDRLKNG